MSAKRPLAPEWSRQPFHRFLEYFENEDRLVHVAAAGIRSLVGAAKLAEALYGVADILDEDEKTAAARYAEAMDLAEVAHSEVEADFPLLHAHSLMGLWGALEALVDDVVLSWLKHRKGLLQEGEFAQVRIPLGAFQRLSVAERLEFLLDQVPRPAGVGGGFPRFELLFDRIGLGGSVDDDLRRSLIEVHQVRNIHAHRGGTIDRKARSACPWRDDWKLGERLEVSHEAYERYVRAIYDYVFVLIKRTGASFGVDVTEGLEERVNAQQRKERASRSAKRRRRLAAARRRLEQQAESKRGSAKSRPNTRKRKGS